MNNNGDINWFLMHREGPVLRSLIQPPLNPSTCVPHCIDEAAEGYAG